MSTSNRTTSTKYSPRPPTRQALDPHGLGIHKGGWEKDNGRTPALKETLQSSSSVSRRHSVVGWVGVSGSGKIQVIEYSQEGTEEHPALLLSPQQGWGGAQLRPCRSRLRGPSLGWWRGRLGPGAPWGLASSPLSLTSLPSLQDMPQ